MVILTIAMIGAAYKIYDLSIKSLAMIQQYGVEIGKIYNIIESLYKMIDKSWFF